MGKYTNKPFEKSELRETIEAIEPHPDVDYSIYSVENIKEGERVYSLMYENITEHGKLANRGSYQRFLDFSRWIESRGGVEKYLHAGQPQLLAVGPHEPPNAGLYATDLEGRKKPFTHVQKAQAASKYKKYVLFHAKLATLQAHTGNKHPHDYIVNLVATGYTYSEIAHAFGMDLGGLVTYVTQNVDPAVLKAAWAARTQLMLDAADKLFEEATTGDFDTECGRDAAKARAEVLSKVGGHLKLQATSRHADYQPAKANISITPGSINISLAAPE